MAFVADPSRRHIEPVAGAILTLVESINQPLVAVPGLPSQAAQAVVCGLRAGGEFEVLVHLHLVNDNVSVIYVWDGGLVGVEEFRQIEAEAVGFVESMGFMVDSINWQAMAPEQRDEVFARLSAFHADLSAFSAKTGKETTGPRDQVDPKILDLARIMASF